MAREDDEYEEGAMSYAAGISLEACPWPLIDRKLRGAWMSGWMDAESRFVDVSKLGHK